MDVSQILTAPSIIPHLTFQTMEMLITRLVLHQFVNSPARLQNGLHTIRHWHPEASTLQVQPAPGLPAGAS